MNAQFSAQTGAGLGNDPDWWRGGVIYQIYPRSFQDSNDDGIGDLKGITQRLPHVASLGVDAIWISPFFKSPMADFGYDVSDYCDIDPMFGTMADFDEMLAAAHHLGVRVIIDLVLSHSSDQHPWFKESRTNRTNAKSDWYVWSDPKEDGTPPNNWLSIFGGSAWQWNSRREQYYLHNFLTSQPDLNFHCPDVQDALLDVTRFWLDKGVDGFRLDTINFYIHDKLLRSNPPLPVDQRDESIAPRVNPYNHQLHLYSKNQPENLDFLKRFRALLDEYEDRTAVGEVGDPQMGLDIMGQYTAGDERVHMCYSFEFLSAHLPTANRFAEVMANVDEKVADGWPCWAFSNHDVIRHASRWDLQDAAKRCLATLLLTLRGTVCLYQGEELGLGEVDVTFDELQDPYGIEFWPEFKGRDGCRTPMVWQQDNSNAGFSAAKPWLPIGSDHMGIAVGAQTNDADSLLNHYRRCIQFRKAHPELAKGTHSTLTDTDGVLHFTREYDGETMLCAFNLTDNVKDFALPPGKWGAIGTDLGAADLGATTTKLGAWQPLLAKKI